MAKEINSLFDKLQSETEASPPDRGITPADLLDLQPELRHLVTTITRRGEMSLAEIVQASGSSSADVQASLNTLVDAGHLRRFEVEGECRYKALLGHRRGRKLPANILDALDS